MQTTAHPARKKTHRMASILTSSLALVLTALLLTAAPLAASPLAQAGGSEAEIADILLNPSDYEGETVTVNGYVSNVNLGNQLFILTTDSRLRLDQLLVITPDDSAQDLSMDQQVSATGTVTTFIPEDDTFVGLELDEEIADSLLGRTVLVADSVDMDAATDADEEDVETAVVVEATGEDAEDEVPATDGIDATESVTATGTTTDTTTGVTEAEADVEESTAATTTLSSNVVARIGTREITQSEFDDWFQNAITIIAARQGIPINEETNRLFVEMQEQFLTQMVREEVLLEEAERRGISVSDEEIQSTIDDIRAQFDSDEAYQAGIAELGFDTEEELRDYIVVSQTLQRVTQEILDEITLTQDEIEQFYEENQDLFTVEGVTAPLEEVQEAISNELKRQRFEQRVTELEENAEIELMAENLGPYEDEVVTTGIPAEPVDEMDDADDVDADDVDADDDADDVDADDDADDADIVQPTEGITEVTDIAPIDTITTTTTFTDVTDAEESNLTEPVPMTPTTTTDTGANVEGMSDVRTASATLMNPDGNVIGSVVFLERNDAMVGIEVNLDENHGLEPGAHGIHIHAVGACSPDFSAAGGHFNPTNAQHGFNNPAGPHAGDLPNLTITDVPQQSLLTLTDRFTLGDGPNSLFDDDGSAVIIHAGEDDQMTDPSGDSGDRVACGVIEPGTNAASDAN